MDPKQIAVLEDFGAAVLRRGDYSLFKGEYVKGSTAIMALDSSGQQAFTLSVNLPDAPTPDADHIWVKDWSENEGIGDELQRRGIIQFTGKTHPTGYCKVRLARITV